MDNNNVIILPLYLQKFIIKILCNHINKNNKLIDSINELIDYRENENEINKLTLTISLVNKSWFKTIQNNLNISVDLNHDNNNNNTTFSILKIENIKTLKLHYCHEKNYFYSLKISNNSGSGCGDIEKEIKIDEINNSLIKLSNSNNDFKNLIIRNIVPPTLSYNLNILNCLNNNNDIELYDLVIDRETNLKYLNEEIKNKIKKLFSIKINYYSMPDVQGSFVFEVIKEWYLKGLKQIFLVSQSYYFPILQLLSGTYNIGHNDNKINYLKNIKIIELHSSLITMDDLLCLLSPKLLPNLNKLLFEICFNKLNYFLSTSNERLENSNFSYCHCDSILNQFQGGIFNNESEEEQNLFNEKWKLLLELAVANKSLNFLKIKHYCKINGSRMLINRNEEPQFSITFLNKLSEFITSFKSLIKFSISAPIPIGLFTQINNKPNNITHFELRTNVYNKLESQYFKDILNEINKIINQTQHQHQHQNQNQHQQINFIKSFKFINLNYFQQIEEIILNYKQE